MRLNRQLKPLALAITLSVVILLGLTAAAAAATTTDAAIRKKCLDQVQQH